MRLLIDVEDAVKSIVGVTLHDSEEGIIQTLERSYPSSDDTWLGGVKDAIDAVRETATVDPAEIIRDFFVTMAEDVENEFSTKESCLGCFYDDRPCEFETYIDELDSFIGRYKFLKAVKR